MFRNMANSVLMKEQIQTTVQKAKEARRVVDRLITLGKSGDAASRRLAFDRTRDNAVVAKLFGDLAKRYEKRAGGYTRVLKMSDRRWGDAAEMALLELVDRPELDRKRKPGKGAAAAKTAEGAEPSSMAEPKKRFGKMFSGTGKSKVSGSKGKGKSTKTAAARKTPAAGGGGNKSGSS